MIEEGFESRIRITLQSMVLIGVVVCALALVVLSLIGLLPNDTNCLEFPISIPARSYP